MAKKKKNEEKEDSGSELEFVTKPPPGEKQIPKKPVVYDKPVQGTRYAPGAKKPPKSIPSWYEKPKGKPKAKETEAAKEAKREILPPTKDEIEYAKKDDPDEDVEEVGGEKKKYSKMSKKQQEMADALDAEEYHKHKNVSDSESEVSSDGEERVAELDTEGEEEYAKVKQKKRVIPGEQLDRKTRSSRKGYQEPVYDKDVFQDEISSEESSRSEDEEVGSGSGIESGSGDEKALDDSYSDDSDSTSESGDPDVASDVDVPEEGEPDSEGSNSSEDVEELLAEEQTVPKEQYQESDQEDQQEEEEDKELQEPEPEDDLKEGIDIDANADRESEGESDATEKAEEWSDPETNGEKLTRAFKENKRSVLNSRRPVSEEPESDDSQTTIPDETLKGIDPSDVPDQSDKHKTKEEEQEETDRRLLAEKFKTFNLDEDTDEEALELNYKKGKSQPNNGKSAPASPPRRELPEITVSKPGKPQESDRERLRRLINEQQKFLGYDEIPPPPPPDETDKRTAAQKFFDADTNKGSLLGGPAKLPKGAPPQQGNLAQYNAESMKKALQSKGYTPNVFNPSRGGKRGGGPGPRGGWPKPPPRYLRGRGSRGGKVWQAQRRHILPRNRSEGLGETGRAIVAKQGTGTKSYWISKITKAGGPSKFPPNWKVSYFKSFYTYFRKHGKFPPTKKIHLFHHTSRKK